MKKLKNRDPHSPEVIAEALEELRRMTPEEAWAFLTYRTPGIEETDMTGQFSQIEPPFTFPPADKPADKPKRRKAASKTQ